MNEDVYTAELLSMIKEWCLDILLNQCQFENKLPSKSQGGPRGVMVKAMDCVIVVSKFVLQSHYYIHFQANTLGKGMNPLILSAMG